MARLPPRLQLVSVVASGAGVIDRPVGDAMVSEYSLINSFPTAQSLKRQAARGGFLFAAVAAAALVILPFTLHRHAPTAHANVVAVGVAPDLGLERD
jgi:hypothetical protein